LIKSLSIHNFQSHKKTILQFDPGINIIVGDTDSGKTSLLRSIYWARFNRPNGDSYISNWNRDNKNKPIKATSVAIENDSCTIKRIKSDSMNGYKIFIPESEEPKILEAVGMDIPEEIPSILNIDETNIQMQLDSPFLLSKSAGDVAKYFNNIIRLDLIDKVLSKAETKRRENNAEKKQAEISLHDVTSKLENFNYLPKAEELINKIEKIEKRVDGNNESIETINNLKNQIGSYDKIITKNDAILSAVATIKKIDVAQLELKAKENTCQQLSESISDWNANNKKTATVDFIKLGTLVNSIDYLRIDIFNRVKKLETITDMVSSYNDNNDTIKESKQEIKDNMELLPDVCPYVDACPYVRNKI